MVDVVLQGPLSSGPKRRNMLIVTAIDGNRARKIRLDAKSVTFQNRSRREAEVLLPGLSASYTSFFPIDLIFNSQKFSLSCFNLRRGYEFLWASPYAIGPKTDGEPKYNHLSFIIYFRDGSICHEGMECNGIRSRLRIISRVRWGGAQVRILLQAPSVITWGSCCQPEPGPRVGTADSTWVLGCDCPAQCGVFGV